MMRGRSSDWRIFNSSPSATKPAWVIGTFSISSLVFQLRTLETEGAATLIRRYYRGRTWAHRDLMRVWRRNRTTTWPGQFLRPLWLHRQSLSGGVTAASDQVSEK